MKSISTFIFAAFITGVFFLALADTGNAGLPIIPGGPPCCEVQTLSGPLCQGGDAGITLCTTDSNCTESDICELFDNATCVEVSQFEGFCQVAEPTPTPTSTAEPTRTPIAAAVPAIGGWGFLSLAVVLGVIGLGAFLARRNRASV